MSSWPDLQTTAGDNTQANTGINTLEESKQAGLLNNGVRTFASYMAAFFLDAFGQITSGGSSNAYTVATTSGAMTANPPIIAFKANHANTGAATVNVDGIGAVNLKKHHDVDLASGDIQVGQIVIALYDSTNYQIISPLSTGLENLTAAEITQLAAIGATTISAAQWAYLGAFNQALATTDNVQFANILSTGTLTAQNNRIAAQAGIDNNGPISIGTGSELTIASGAITVTSGYHRIDTEGDASTDDLGTINGGTAGDILVLRIVSNSRSVVVRDGIGNIVLAGGANFTMDNSEDTLTLIYQGANWLELSRSDNS